MRGEGLTFARNFSGVGLPFGRLIEHGIHLCRNIMHHFGRIGPVEMFDNSPLIVKFSYLFYI